MNQRNSRLIGGVYQVGQMISSGPVLHVYTAYNRNTNNVVGLLVIKLPPAFHTYPAGQLLASLELRKRVQSPHAIHIYDWGVYEGMAYIATDPPRGVSLRHLEDHENIDLARALDLIIQITRGIAALQANGIVDTDLRPQMITVDTIGQNDRVQLDDVGLRMLFRQLGYVQSQNSQDIAYLDPRYMAPESIYHRMIGSPSDVYQLGILLFELITGRPPFVGRTPAETGMMQSNSPIPPMAQFKHNTPQALQEIANRALAKDPAQRFPHAAAMLIALESLPQLHRSATLSELPLAGGQSTTSPGGLPPTVKHADATTEMTSLHVNVPLDAADTLIEGDRTARREVNTSPLPAENAEIYAYLDFEQAGTTTQRLPIKEKYVIVGRVDPKRGITPEVDLTSFDTHATISRQHARIRFEKTFFYIEDLKSRNKTRLGELVLAPLKPELLQHGDVIFFGSVRVVFRVPGMHTPPVLKPLP